MGVGWCVRGRKGEDAKKMLFGGARMPHAGTATFIIIKRIICY